MATIITGSNTAIGKVVYPDGLMPQLIKDMPLFGAIKKRTNFYAVDGEYLAWQLSTGPGVGVTFSNAQTNKGALTIKRPLITRSTEYAVGSISHELLKCSKHNEEALAEAYITVVDGLMYGVRKSLGTRLYGNGGGSLFRSTAVSGSSTPWTITIPRTASKLIQIGSVLQRSTDDGTSGSVVSGNYVVTSIAPNASAPNTSTDVIIATNSGSPDTPNSDDYYFRDGDFGVGIKGLGAWVPATAPSASENFFGVDRSVAADYMSGTRYSNTTGTIQDTLLEACAIAADMGARQDFGVLNPRDWATLSKELGSQRIAVDQVPAQIDPPGAKANRRVGFGYDAIGMASGSGLIKFIADPFCPPGSAWVGRQETAAIWSADDAVDILDLDGNTMLRETSSDASEIRVGGYLQMVITEPMQWTYVGLPQ